MQATEGKVDAPPMKAFVPGQDDEPDEAPADFDSWAQALLGAFVPQGA